MENPDDSSSSDNEISKASPDTEMMVIDIRNLLASRTEVHSPDEDPSLNNLKKFLGSATSFHFTLDMCLRTSFRIEAVVGTGSTRNQRHIYECYGEKSTFWMCCCWTPNSTKQTLVITDGEYSMSVVFRPRICCNSSEDRILEIFIPERLERIGWIQTEGTVGEKSRIHVNGTELLMTEQTGDGPNPFMICVEDTHHRGLVACGKASDWSFPSTRNSQSVEIEKFVFSMGNYDVQMRAVLFAAYAVMMYDQREQEVIHYKYVFLGILLLICGFLMFLMLKGK